MGTRKLLRVQARIVTSRRRLLLSKPQIGVPEIVGTRVWTCPRLAPFSLNESKARDTDIGAYSRSFLPTANMSSFELGPCQTTMRRLLSALIGLYTLSTFIPVNAAPSGPIITAGLQLSGSTFESTIGDAPPGTMPWKRTLILCRLADGAYLIEFYSPYCVHCKQSVVHACMTHPL